MIVEDKMTQGSDAWFSQRMGRPTASEFKRIITAKTGKLSESRHEYINELIAETYMPAENCMESSWLFTGNKFTGNKFTDHGNEIEPEAREKFAEFTGLEVVEVGFIMRDDLIVGASPDGLIVDESGRFVGGLEIKCKCLKNHLEALRTKELPADHKAQVHGSLAVSGLPVWHFWSYFPEFPGVHIEVRPDDYTAKVSDALDSFLIEYAEARQEVTQERAEKGGLF